MVKRKLTKIQKLRKAFNTLSAKETKLIKKALTLDLIGAGLGITAVALPPSLLSVAFLSGATVPLVKSALVGLEAVGVSQKKRKLMKSKEFR